MPPILACLMCTRNACNKHTNVLEWDCQEVLDAVVH
jgi:hypothetical protein